LGKIFRDLYGWFLHLWRLIRPMSSQSRTCPRMLCRKEFDFELGKVPLHGTTWDYPGLWNFKKKVEVDKPKIEVKAKPPTPKCVKDICSFLRHTGFYCRFIKDFSKIVRPLTNLLVKDVLSSLMMNVLTLEKSSKWNLSLRHNFWPGLVQTIWDHVWRFRFCYRCCLRITHRQQVACNRLFK